MPYQMTSSVLSEGACLDNNHTHFILVDDGTINKFGGEIKFRASLENCISQKTMEKACGKNGNLLIPRAEHRARCMIFIVGPHQPFGCHF